MISITHIIFGLALSYILDKRLVTASVFAIVPDFDITFSFLYPFVHRGIMHSLLAASVASVLVYAYSDDRVSAESCFLGYSSHLGLDLLTSSGVPIFFPLLEPVALDVASAYDLAWNSSIIAVSIAGMLSVKHRKVFETFTRLD